MAEPKKDPGKSAQSPLANLPRKANHVPVTNEPAPKEATASNSPQPSKKEKSKTTDGHTHRFGPPFWTIASILSFAVNLVLIIILLVVWLNAQRLVDSIGGAMNMGNFLLGGLHSNFEKMDRAHITATIPVQTEIPVKFDLQLNQQTNVVLSQDVTINNALVTVKTGGLNIVNALTTIVLPQGTNLPIVLNLTVPVDKMVPVTLNVDVDIPLEKTQLHDPFVGLQKVVEPFYCLVNPGALNLNQQPVCK